ncbi:MAG: amino acid carrier protein [Porticoccaceae bacterium]
MESLQGALNTINGFVWGPYLLLPLLLLTGLYLTVRLGGLQFRVLFHAFWLAFFKRDQNGDSPGDVSHYQALLTALAATIGVGNIAGVATAIGIGGPGALFWVWLTGLVGMATKYSEALLGVKFRRTDAAGEQTGGPMEYLREGVGGKFGWLLGSSFALFGIAASFGIGNMVQANTAASQLAATWDIPVLWSGLLMTLLTGIVILGGIKSIARFAAAIVPTMIVLYVVSNLIVLAVFHERIPDALLRVFHDAFSGSAAAGGFAGSAVILAIQIGVSRGIFSNESGMGTGGIAAASAKTTQPVHQAMVSMTQTFIDTLIMVTFTAMTLIVTDAYTQVDLRGAAMTAWAIEQGLGNGWGIYTVTIAVVVYAFTTIIGWSYYGERCAESLLGRRAIFHYRLVFTLVVMVGAMTTLDMVWTFSDIANGLMALPNLVGLLLLSGIVAKETRAYFSQPDWKTAPD